MKFLKFLSVFTVLIIVFSSFSIVFADEPVLSEPDAALQAPSPSYAAGFTATPIKWNQVCQNGNFALVPSSSNGSVTVENNICTFTCTSVSSWYSQRVVMNANLVSGHKILFTGEFYSTGRRYIFFGNNSYYVNGYTVADSWTKIFGIITAPSNLSSFWIIFHVNNISVDDTVQIRNVMAFDLTEMYGSGNEPSADVFFQRYPAAYYPYDSGTLQIEDDELSFTDKLVIILIVEQGIIIFYFLFGRAWRA